MRRIRSIASRNALPAKLLVSSAIVFSGLGSPSFAAQQAQHTGQPSKSVSQSKPESLAEAARAARAQKPASPSARVYTNDDMPNLARNGVSVVGNQRPAPAATANSANAAKPVEKGEVYWHARWKTLNDRLIEVNADIKELNDDAANYWTVGYPIRDDYVFPYLWDLQAEKAKLEQELDALKEEARKAYADPGWLR